jgi:hypothetical protein
MTNEIPKFAVYWLRFFPFIFFYKLDGKWVRSRTYFREWRKHLKSLEEK